MNADFTGMSTRSQRVREEIALLSRVAVSMLYRTSCGTFRTKTQRVPEDRVCASLTLLLWSGQCVKPRQAKTCGQLMDTI
jgi:hypothetical protein